MESIADAIEMASQPSGLAIGKRKSIGGRSAPIGRFREPFAFIIGETRLPIERLRELFVAGNVQRLTWRIVQISGEFSFPIRHFVLVRDYETFPSDNTIDTGRDVRGRPEETRDPCTAVERHRDDNARHRLMTNPRHVTRGFKHVPAVKAIHKAAQLTSCDAGLGSLQDAEVSKLEDVERLKNLAGNIQQTNSA